MKYIKHIDFISERHISHGGMNIELDDNDIEDIDYYEDSLVDDLDGDYSSIKSITFNDEYDVNKFWDNPSNSDKILRFIYNVGTTWVVCEQTKENFESLEYEKLYFTRSDNAANGYLYGTMKISLIKEDKYIIGKGKIKDILDDIIIDNEGE